MLLKLGPEIATNKLNKKSFKIFILLTQPAGIYFYPMIQNKHFFSIASYYCLLYRFLSWVAQINIIWRIRIYFCVVIKLKGKEQRLKMGSGWNIWTIGDLCSLNFFFFLLLIKKKDHTWVKRRIFIGQITCIIFSRFKQLVTGSFTFKTTNGSACHSTLTASL